MKKEPDIIVAGGGLAGTESAYQSAELGMKVRLYEMRPEKMTDAHRTPFLAELVCSNSLGSNLPDRASGLLKEELHLMGSLLISIAGETAVPAGGALAVDRELFAKRVTERIESHPNIEVVRKELTALPEGVCIIATGPLTSEAMGESIASLAGTEHLFFYDAIAPVVYAESINTDIAFRASRYRREEEGDYLNCPMTKDEYGAFIDALLGAERAELKSFEKDIGKGVKAGYGRFFEGCLPVEIMAERGRDSLAFGPLRPVGLRDPRTGRRPYAVVQLRQENLSATLYNLVGFQTNLKHGEQERVFRMIPGLEKAEFARYGGMHRNTFIASPALIDPTLECRKRRGTFFAGQVTGVEGYAGNIATGVLAGINAGRKVRGLEPLELPATTMTGALCRYVANAGMETFQPMKANFGLLPPLEMPVRGGKTSRAAEYSRRAIEDIKSIQEANKKLHTEDRKYKLG